MYVILPMSNCTSPEARDQFIELLSAIAKVTKESEPQALSYAWFRSAGDNDVVPHHWVRGLEVYEELSASTEVHRSSAEYKAMRAAVGANKLLERASDLRFLRPTGVGFLNRSLSESTGDVAGSEYVIVDELRPKPAQGHENPQQLLLEDLKSAVKELETISKQDQCLTFWVLEYLPEYADETLVVVSRYPSKQIYDEIFKSTGAIQNLKTKFEELCSWHRTTTWIGAGFGFVGRRA